MWSHRLPYDRSSVAEPIDAEELLALLRRPEDAEMPVTDGRSPFTPVELEPGSDARIASLTGADLGHAGRVVVGISRDLPEGPAPDLFDIALCPAPPDGGVPRGWVACPDPGEEAAALEAACGASPGAAAALGQLLRLNERLPVEEGIAAESFAY